MSAESGSGNGYTSAEVEGLLSKLYQVIDSARPVPLSASSMINKDEVLAMVEEINAKLPDELRAARWLLKEREEFLAKVRREGDEILEVARGRAEQMVQRTEVVKAAEARSRQIVETADADARRLRLEAEDYCDQKLGSFENVLQRTLKQVSAGRAKLQGDPLADLADTAPPASTPPSQPPPPDPRQMVQPAETEQGFFEQDGR